MYKRILLSLFMVVLLVACDQNLDQESNQDLTDTTATEDINSEEAASEDEKSNETDTATNQPEEESNDNKEINTDTESNDSLPELKVHYIDVGQADATLFQYGEHTILFDIGDWRGNEVVNYLNSQGVSQLDLVIGSHPDADHIGQLEDVMTNFSVGEVWLSGNDSTSATFQRGLEAVLKSGADYHEPRTGEEFEIGAMNLKVLYPESISGASNEESISVLFTYGDMEFLFTGDADTSGEKDMMNSGISIDADFLQLGHHGSNTSSSSSFINAVNPEVAIYSAGADNSYGHPHAEVVTRIKNAGIELYGTDVHGTIIVTTDGKDYTIQTKKDGTITPKSTNTTNDSSNTSSSSNSSSSSGSSSNDLETNSSEQSPSNESCVNINTASYDEVQQIIHIGPERAQDLIDLRPFSSVSDLDRIKGIGPARIKDIEAQGLACVN